MKVTALTFEVSQLIDTPKLSQDQRAAKFAAVAPADLAARPSGAPAAANPVFEKPVVNGLGLQLQFSIDQQTGQSVIRVLDIESGKVVRQIPSEEVLAFLRQLEERKGLVLSRRF